MTVEGAQHTFPQGRAWSLCDVLGWREQDSRCMDGGAQGPAEDTRHARPGTPPCLLCPKLLNPLFMNSTCSFRACQNPFSPRNICIFASVLFCDFYGFFKKLKSFTHLEYILKYSERWVLFSHDLSISPVPVIWGMKSILSPLID